jgi:NADH dehydrogenase
VARIGGLKLSGFLAWLVWLFVHIMYLIGFRNRMVVLVDWAWAYLTWQRGVRLITGEPRLELEHARSGDEVTSRAAHTAGALPSAADAGGSKDWAESTGEGRKRAS